MSTYFSKIIKIPLDNRRAISYIVLHNSHGSAHYPENRDKQRFFSRAVCTGVVASACGSGAFMAASKRISWSKMDFKDFIDHYKNMTPEEIVADVHQSIEDFEKRNTDSDSFGSKQVRKADTTSKVRRATASRENGKLGGRPRKAASRPAEPPIIDRTATQVPPKPKRPPCPIKTQNKIYTIKPMPRNPDEVMDVVYRCNLDGDDAYQWYQMTVVDRHGRDRYGQPIRNWPGALIRFCETKAARRAM